MPWPDSTKQFACPSKECGHRAARDVLHEVLDEDLDREVRDRAGLRGGQVARVAERPDVRVGGGPHRVLVDRHVVELVAQARAGDEVGAHVERDRDELVVGDLALVVGDEDLPVLVDPLDHEVGFDDDALLLEEGPEGPARDRLGERAVERRDEDELGDLAQPALAQPVVSEEGELQWGDRALDRQLGDVHDEPAAGEALRAGRAGRARRRRCRTRRPPHATGGPGCPASGRGGARCRWR